MPASAANMAAKMTAILAMVLTLTPRELTTCEHGPVARKSQAEAPDQNLHAPGGTETPRKPACR
jgi:hypothetical protein